MKSNIKKVTPVRRHPGSLIVLSLIVATAATVSSNAFSQLSLSDSGSPDISSVISGESSLELSEIEQPADVATENADVLADDLADLPDEISPNIPPNLPPINPIPLCRIRADLIVSALPNPTWDAVHHQSVIPVVIRNVGGRGTGSAFYVRLDADGHSYLIATPALAAGASRVVTFRLNYWIYNPDASYTATVDSTNRIPECRETNNRKSFFGIG